VSSGMLRRVVYVFICSLFNDSFSVTKPIYSAERKGDKAAFT